MADNTVNVMPGIKNILGIFDWMIFDRTDEKQRKQAVYMSIEHQYNYQTAHGSLNPLVIFPEGALCTPGYLLPFKTGAFNMLRGVQFLKLNYMKDYFTGITPSPAKSMAVMFLVNFARTYAYVEYQFEDPVDYDD